MNRLQTLFAAIALLASSATMAAPTSINFDGQSAPCTFSASTALTGLYSSSGVVFSNSNASSSAGAILNQCGGFGFSAHSGTDFLAYNASAFTLTLTFSSLVDSVSIWGASTYGGTLTMKAYDASNQLIGSSSVAGNTTWKQLAFSSAGIGQVQLSASGAGGFDDLSFTAAAATVPEPGMLALVGLGLFGVAASRRLRA